MPNERFTVSNESSGRPVRPGAARLQIVGRAENGPRVSVGLANQLEKLIDPTILGVVLRMRDGSLEIVGDVVQDEVGVRKRAVVSAEGDEATLPHKLHQGFLIPMRAEQGEEAQADDLCSVPLEDAPEGADSGYDNVVSIAPSSPEEDDLPLLHRGGDIILKTAVVEQLRQVTHPAVMAVILDCLDNSRAAIDVRKGLQKGIVTPAGFPLNDNVLVYNEVEDGDDLERLIDDRFEPFVELVAESMAGQICDFVDHESDSVSPKVVYEGIFILDDHLIREFCMTNGYEVAVDNQSQYLQPRSDALRMFLEAVQVGITQVVSKRFSEKYDRIYFQQFVLNFNTVEGKFFIACKADIARADAGILRVCKAAPDAADAE